jgi:hypothetical protein
MLPGPGLLIGAPVFLYPEKRTSFCHGGKTVPGWPRLSSRWGQPVASVGPGLLTSVLRPVPHPIQYVLKEEMLEEKGRGDEKEEPCEGDLGAWRWRLGLWP